jgi:hypothetical protein
VRTADPETIPNADDAVPQPVPRRCQRVREESAGLGLT